MANGIADYLNVSQQDLLGSAAPNMPMANTMMPGYDQEMNIDDTGRITLRNYLQEFRDNVGDGITNKGMSLFDNSQRSNLTRAGLGALLFGFNPITAVLGAFAGSKLPGITSAFQQGKFNPIEFVREKRAEREAAREAAARAEFDRLFANAQQNQQEIKEMVEKLEEVVDGIPCDAFRRGLEEERQEHFGLEKTLLQRGILPNKIE